MAEWRDTEDRLHFTGDGCTDHVDGILQQNQEELAKIEPLPEVEPVATLIIQKHIAGELEGQHWAWVQLGILEGSWVPVPDYLLAQLPMMLAMVKQLTGD